MSNVLTIRLPGSLLSKVDKKAAALGRSRTEHVRQLLEEDVAKTPQKTKRFACLHLIGSCSLSPDSSTNTAIRAAMRRRYYEKNR